MGLLDSGLRYRVRIFDNGNHLKTIIVPDKGQSYIPVTVHSPNFGLFGEKTRVAFMINPEVKPFIFGQIIELNFDVRDACQLADLIDLVPDIVLDINKNYETLLALHKEEKDRKNGTINAEFTEIGKDSEILLDPVQETQTEIKPEEEEEKRPIEKIADGAKAAAEIATTLIKVKTAKEEEKEKTILEALAICKKYPRLLYWLPKKLEIEPEIKHLVTQMRIKRVGTIPSLYKASVEAPIAEKTLTRPALKKGWEDVVLVAVVGLILLVFVYLITHVGG